MKLMIIGMAVVLALGAVVAATAADDASREKIMRHVVAIKFKPGTGPEEIKKVEEAFRALKTKIPQIAGLEWGLNNSAEGRDKGFTHCFILGFKSEDDRNTYLTHPAHKAFGGILRPVMEDVLVIDFWARD